MLSVSSAGGEERAEFQRLFDRSAEYRDLMAKVEAFKVEFAQVDTLLGRRQLKILRRDLEAIMAMDYFPGPTKEEAEDRLAEVETLFFASLSPGEPQTVPGQIAPRERAAYQGRVWATRQHVWIDRLASAWLVRRFIDADAAFVWLEKLENCPADAVGFDFDGAEFSHVGKRVTFEVLLAAFGLDKDPLLGRIAAVVHFLDAGGTSVAEAPGVEMVLSGLRRQCINDDELLVQAMGLFDSMYAASEQ